MGVGVFRAEGHSVVWFYQHLECGGVLGPQGFPDKSREVKRALWRNCLDITRKMRKEMGPDRKKELVSGNPHFCGFLLKNCSAGWEMESKHVWDGLGMRTQGSLFITAVDSQPQQLGGRN